MTFLDWFVCGMAAFMILQTVQVVGFMDAMMKWQKRQDDAILKLFQYEEESTRREMQRMGSREGSYGTLPREI